MTYLSKSKYCSLWQCPKILWLQKNKPEASQTDDSLTARLEAGTEVGALARELFGPYVDVTSYKEEKLDIPQMITSTREALDQGRPVICEAAFSHKGLYCAVDILKKENEGWAIYEVKSSTSEDKAVYCADLAYQKYVLENCGIKVTGTYLVYINKDYVFDGNLKIQELFKIADLAPGVSLEEKNIETNLALAENILKASEEPEMDLSLNCMDPYACRFWSYCSDHLPSPSVFDLYRLPAKKKFEYYQKGYVTYEDLIKNVTITNEKQVRQIKYGLQDKGTHIEKENIRDFLDTLSYPLYFLDFETIQPVIPKFIGTRPYAQIPFQYSLHYIESEGGELKHKEFLAESGPDPRRTLAEKLCQDIPLDVCVTAYNKAFECYRLKELAKAFPDLEDHLMNIHDNMIDLLTPFQSSYYYNRAIGGSFSIKSVLPAIFPDDPELNYKALKGVQNGDDAMNLFPKIQYMEPEDQAKARQSLLEYCKLDTYAMVKIWQELVRVVG